MYQVETKSFLSCLTFKSEMAERIDAYDWSKTPLGDIHSWPLSLQNVVTLMLSSGLPMQIAWGDEHIQIYNDAYIPILGHGALHPSLGQSAQNTWPEAWLQMSSLWNRVKETGEPFIANDMRFMLKRNGFFEERFFNLSIAPLRNDDFVISGILVTVLETTERFRNDQKLHSDLLKLQNEIEEYREGVTARDEFMSLASHDLKSPLTALKLQTQTQKQLVLRKDPRGFDKDRIKQFSELVDEQVGRLNLMVDDMLEIGRIRRGKLILKREEAELGRIVRNSIEGMRTQFSARNFPQVRTNKMVKGFWDCEKIKQVVVNILLNAIRLGNNSPLEITVDSIENFALLTITDNSVYIPDDQLQKIFDRYERMGPKVKTAHDHGLFLTKKIVEAHDGVIRVETHQQGTIFKVMLPGLVSVPALQTRVQL